MYFWTVAFIILRIATFLPVLAILVPFILCGAVLYGLVVGVTEGAIWLWACLPTRPVQPLAAPKPPGIIRAWLRAKKDRVCPLLEWEE